MTQSLGLITGNGFFPELVLREAKAQGFRIALCAIREETDPRMESLADTTHWIRLGQLGAVVDFFKREHIHQAIMAGKITKTNLLKGDIRPDFEMIKALATVKNHSDDSLLGAIANHLNSKGIKLLPSVSFLTEESLPKKGILTKRKPSKDELADIEFGWKLAKEIGRLDIGQTVVVKNEAILAVEAIEGTDEAILRGGQLGSGDVTVVKVAKPLQDMRFDVPTIGLKTLQALIQVKARALAFEAGKTILLDRKQFMDQANEHRMTVIGKE